MIQINKADLLKDQFLQSFKRQTKNLFLRENLPLQVIQAFIKDHRLSSYIPLRFYLFKMLLHYQASKSEKNEEKLFSLWTYSEFDKLFFQEFKRTHSIKKSAQHCEKLYLNQIKNIYKKHVLNKTVSTEYIPILALGDHLHIKNKKLFSHVINLNDDKFHFYCVDQKNLEKQALKIKKALFVLKKHYPLGSVRLKCFTSSIISHQQKNLVSYSHQDIPGHSVINIFDRDFVDLLDDLIHENGHHHLNLILNQKKLIIEDSDFRALSPWRRSERPLRGLYHAYFTFFWGFDLFRSLAVKKREIDSKTLKESQIQKIQFRCLQEALYLNITYNHLKKARAMGLISPEAWKLILPMQNKIKTFLNNSPIRLGKLPKKYQTQINNDCLKFYQMPYKLLKKSHLF